MASSPFRTLVPPGVTPDAEEGRKARPLTPTVDTSQGTVTTNYYTFITTTPPILILFIYTSPMPLPTHTISTFRRGLRIQKWR